jgi:hypothetical protein
MRRIAQSREMGKRCSKIPGSDSGANTPLYSILLLAPSPLTAISWSVRGKLGKQQIDADRIVKLSLLLIVWWRDLLDGR